MRALVWLLACLIAVSVVTAAGEASAQPEEKKKKKSVETLIEKGQRFFDEQRYEESIQTLSAALLRPGISDEEKIRVYQLLAYNYIVLQQKEEADAAVRGLLVVDPEFTLPDTESPRFREFFEQVAEDWNDEGRPGLDEGEDEDETQVEIEHTSPAKVDAGATVSLSGSIVDPEATVDDVVLFYRSGSAEKFETAEVQYAMRKFTADIPDDAVEPPLVEYYIQALDEGGLPVALRGDAETPLRIAVPEDASVVESPYLWVPVSLAVVAAVVVPVVIVTTSTPESTVSVNVFQ